MRTTLLPLASLLIALPSPVHAQAHPGCPERPHTLAAMRSCYRPLLVFSPSARDPRFQQQLATLDGAADDMMDRFMVVIPVLSTQAGYTAPLDAPTAMLMPKQAAAERRRFGVAAGAFKVVLFDEDGSSVLESPHPLGMDRIDGVIDAMPRRQEEERRPDSN